jgi:hypothetical protein
MKKHLLLVLLRGTVANGIWQVMPFAHLTWGPQRANTGPQALRFVLVLHLIGLAAAIIYFFAASGAHLVLRRQRLRAIAFADTVIAAGLAAALLYWGMTVTYREPPAAPPVVATREPGHQSEGTRC